MNQINKILVMCFLLNLFGCKQGKQPNATGTINPADISIPVEHIEPTPDQKARRLKSEAYCNQYNIPVYKNPNALFSDAEDDVIIRSKDEVADRALAIMYIALKGEGLEQEHLDKVEKKYSIAGKLTPEEKVYMTTRELSQQQRVNATWQYESLHVMLWALGYVDSLSYPDTVCDVGKDVEIIASLSEQEFKDKAKLRSKQEILDQADLILRLDWACVSARVRNQPAPANLDSSIVYERHRSLNWLINYMEADWDDVTTDT